MPFEQIGQSAVKRLWRQKSEFTRSERNHRAPLPESPPVTTAILSDLHLGAASNADLLQRPDVRARLFSRLAGADQVALLGDVLELRDVSRAEAIDAAGVFFEELGDVLGGGRVVVVPGNHDHHLALPLLEATTRPLRLEQLFTPAPSDPLGPLAKRLGGTELAVAYPGVWLRPGVYATHGHYMDYHGSVPTLECLAIGLSKKTVPEPATESWSPDDYEVALAPVYAVIDRLAQGTGGARKTVGAGASVRLLERLGGNGDRQRLGGQLVEEVLFPRAVAAVNRAGIGRFNTDLSGAELRRAGLRAMREVVGRLAIDAEHVVFGHTHRAGPFPGEEDEGWSAGDTRLTNTGSWVYEPAFLTPEPGDSPYWPGTIALLEGSGAPRLERLLDDVPHEQLRA